MAAIISIGGKLHLVVLQLQ